MIAASLRGIRGGVGTSATLAALAYALQAMEQKVLVVDKCPENTLGLHFNLDLTPLKAGRAPHSTSNPGTRLPGKSAKGCACCPTGT